MAVATLVSRLAKGIAAAGLAASISLPAWAQSEGELRAEQTALFQQMYEDPTNLELMYAYALLSIRLKDYEPAISTLERILIFQPDTPQVELELGASYYRIGSYAIARFYFDEARNDPKASEEVVSRAERFLGEINKRTEPSTVVGSVSFNTILTTNANNGPPSRFIDFGGLVVRLDGDNVTAQTDIGASVAFQATHIYDLGGLNNDSWRTNVSAFSSRYESTPSGAADVLILRTGPQLSLDDERHGPKIRPYAEFDHVRSGNDALYTTAGAGFQYSDTIDASTALRTDLRLGYRDYHNGNVQDQSGLQARGSAGIRYAVDDATTLRALALIDYDGADAKSLRSVEFGAGLSVSYRYVSGFSFAPRPWILHASARLLRREYFEDDVVAAVRRRDTDLRLSLGHTAFLTDDFALTLRGEYFRRFSNSRNFRLESLSLNFGATHLF